MGATHLDDRLLVGVLRCNGRDDRRHCNLYIYIDRERADLRLVSHSVRPSGVGGCLGAPQTTLYIRANASGIFELHLYMADSLVLNERADNAHTESIALTYKMVY